MHFGCYTQGHPGLDGPGKGTDVEKLQGRSRGSESRRRKRYINALHAVWWEMLKLQERHSDQ
jgi:hypothetical protein